MKLARIPKPIISWSFFGDTITLAYRFPTEPKYHDYRWWSLHPPHYDRFFQMSRRELTLRDIYEFFPERQA